jgi:hypothetical protein
MCAAISARTKVGKTAEEAYRIDFHPGDRLYRHPKLNATGITTLPPPSSSSSATSSTVVLGQGRGKVYMFSDKTPADRAAIRRMSRLPDADRVETAEEAKVRKRLIYGYRYFCFLHRSHAAASIFFVLARTHE